MASKLASKLIAIEELRALGWSDTRILELLLGSAK